MSLTWTPANLSDHSLAGFAGDIYEAQVVEYDVPPGWAGFIHGHRVGGGPWSTAEEACRAVERALAEGPIG